MLSVFFFFTLIKASSIGLFSTFSIDEDFCIHFEEASVKFNGRQDVINIILDSSTTSHLCINDASCSDNSYSFIEGKKVGN